MNWLRLYVDLPRDLKIRREPLATRWAWIAVLTLTRRSPRPPYLLLAEGVPVRVEDVADEANITTAAADRAMKTFVERRMVHHQDIEAGLDRVWVATNWRKRQPNSDDGGARVIEHRKRVRNVTHDDTTTAPSNEGVTPPDTDTEGEAERDSPSEPIHQEGTARAPEPIERTHAFAIPKPGLPPGSPQVALLTAFASASGYAEPSTPSSRKKWIAGAVELLHASPPVTSDELPTLVERFREENSVPVTLPGIANQLPQLRSAHVPGRPNGRHETTRAKLDRVFGGTG